MSEQQAERQKKSILQLCLAFHGRTEQLVKEKTLEVVCSQNS